ncbi:MAG: CRTAC1 family protein [Methylococcales bacterium]|nr:CRTAC1 family protein [Methylococcales bacterium]
MLTLLKSLRQRATLIVALSWVGLLYLFMALPTLSQTERRQLAGHFHFTPLPLPELQDPVYKTARAVHPSLERISAWISSVGAGIALADADGDGLPNDLCQVDPRNDQVMLAPTPGGGSRYAPFTLYPAALPYDPATMAPMGCLSGDFNEDGAVDFLVYYWGRTPVAYLQRSRPQPSAFSADSFLAVDIAPGGERWFTNAATQADLDGDGHVDIIIGNYFKDGAHILDAHGSGVEEMHDTKSKAFNGGRKHLLLWAAAAGGDTPAVRFQEAQGVLFEEIDHGWALGVGAADLDGDLLPELYFGHDFGPDRLLHNRSEPGRPQFAVLEGERGPATPKSFVMGRDSFKGMGAEFGDLNGDGLLDIYVSNITSEFALQESHLLWLSTGETSRMKQGFAPYVQASEKLGLSRSGWGWDTRLADFDNDGALEAVQATGFIMGEVDRWPELQSLGTGNDRMMSDPRHWPKFRAGDDISGHEANAFFVRAADGRYYNLSADLGLDGAMVTRGIATADVDGDGDMDFAVANQWQPSVFYRNDCPDCGRSLGLHLLLNGDGENLAERQGNLEPGGQGRPAIGAEARLTLPDGRLLVSQVDGGNGHSGKRSPDLHFGLGHIAADARLSVLIRWRDTHGHPHQQTIDLSPGRHIVQLG